MTTQARRAVRTANLADLDTVTTVLAAAFFDGDLAPWLVAPASDRHDVYPQYFGLLAEHALRHGLVEVTGDGLGVAIWHEYPGDDRGITPIDDYDYRLRKATSPYTLRFIELDQAMAAHHPTGRAHFYLALLAVHPDRQGHGYGTGLLTHRHAALDTLGRPAYLEATSKRNRDLYAWHGYRPLKPYRPGTGAPRLYPMWRDPQPPTG